MERAWRIISRIWPFVFASLLVWAALATIAPESFQVRPGAFGVVVGVITGYLLHPATIRILLALTVIWLAVYLRRLEPQDLRPLESRLRALETRPKPGSLREFAESLRDQGLLDEPQRKQDTSTVAALNRLLTDGDDLLSKVKSIGVWNQPAKVSNALENIVRWEQEVREWLKVVKPDFQDDFIANFTFPAGTDPREPLIHRLAARLERLRAVKASII